MPYLAQLLAALCHGSDLAGPGVGRLIRRDHGVNIVGRVDGNERTRRLQHASGGQHT